MAKRLLLSLRAHDQSNTFAFDDSVQSVQWIGLTGGVDASDALAYVEAKEGAVLLRPVGDTTIGNHDKNGPALQLNDSEEMILGLQSPRLSCRAMLYVRPATQGVRTFRKYVVERAGVVRIGRNQACNFCYGSRFVSAQHAELRYSEEGFSITDLESGNGTYLNGIPIARLQPIRIAPGDVVQILDLCICFGKNAFVVNHPLGFTLSPWQGMAPLPHSRLREYFPAPKQAADEPNLFYPAPRLSKSIHPITLQVDDPPAKKPEEDQPVIMQIGPSFLMGISSVFMVSSSIANIANGGSVLSSLPSIAMAIAMIGGSVVWPIIARSYNRRRDSRDEARRGRLYVTYLDGIENKLSQEADVQAQILTENRQPVATLVQRAEETSPLLMNRTSVHSDFMDLRVGIGDTEIESDVTWPQRHFSLADDRMLDRVTELSKDPPMLLDVPMAFNPAKNFNAGILGEREEAWSFLRGLLVQVCALYSYQDVKVVVIGDADEREEWEFLNSLGHFYDDAGAHRFVALSYTGLVAEDLLLERELASRAESRAEVLGDYGTYYVIVCASHSLAERSEAVRRLLRLRSNRGFSLLYLGHDLRDLPRECGYIIDLGMGSDAHLGITLDGTAETARQRNRRARMFERSDASGTLVQFDPDIMVTREQARAFALGLARVRLDMPEQRSAMPDSVGFLEMFQAGNVSHLNVGQRWSENDASQTLQTPVGIDEQGELAILNLHENIHGPHGLVAGTTGSGKSEFIITYVLSLCVNYAPDEVSFVLIDYKGGGLAGAFDNDRYQLPHLAGTITNLDGAAIKRSLVSIESELKRRQRIFNEARDITGESTIDIYKYLSFYRQGVLTEPLPHLFIVADEFAELKQQEPEFMEQLVSTARIGRSLGVHLILATQKPSGVVDDQIMSNSRFKVCLKVSDASDSREMIQREDAAEITSAGRYYMLVGYNDSFMSGQAAYAGGAYSPIEKYEPKRDNAVELLDEEGDPVARLRPKSQAVKQNTTEMNAVLAQIIEASNTANKKARRLWLDPLPEIISLESIWERYGNVATDGLTCVVGEIDDPDNQSQMRYDIDLVQDGNVLLYGSQSSDVDGLLQSMIVSMAREYDASQLWFYGIDLGAGELSLLGSLPHCGGVTLPGDDELVDNLFRMLKEKVSERRKLLSSYGGDLGAYNAQSKNPLPYIVVAVSNLASFTELYSDYEEDLISLTRDAPRYGIFFLLTAATASTPRFRLKANFPHEIVTVLNDQADYLSLFGSMNGVVAPQAPRRGLVKVGKRVLEFQGARATGEGESLDDLLIKITEAQSGVEGAYSIPRLPEYVSIDEMGDSRISEGLVPVGFSKRGVAPAYFDFTKSPYMLVMGNDADSIGMYLRGLREALAASEDISYRVVDMQESLGDVIDENVLTDEKDVEALVSQLDSGDAPKILVFTSVAQTIEGLAEETSRSLQDYIARERGVGKTYIVAATEAWRVRSLYQDWYKVLSAYANGVWTGSGFSDQTVFRFSRSLPEYREPAMRSDGFLAMRGNVTSVRLLEARDEPKAIF